MMADKKDLQLEKAFEEYFDGNDAPNIDLGRAKAELGEARRRRQRRKRISAVLSACAAFALVLALTFTVLPMFLARSGAGHKGDLDMSEAPNSPNNSEDLSPAPGDGDHSGDVANDPLPPPESNVRDTVYSLSAVKIEEMSYAQLRGTFSSYMKEFDTIEADVAVVCRYSLYVYDGVAVMIGAEITCRSDDAPFTAVVYADLSGGRYKAKELAGYSELPQGNGYRIATEQIDCEYLSRIHWVKNGERFAQVSSSSEQGAQAFLNYFL